MDSDFCEDIDDNYERKVYTTYINADVSAGDEKREFSTFDAFPTTLAALGVKIEGNRLGLGTNLFSDEQTLTEIYGVEKENLELSRNSKFLEDLESVDEDSEALKQRHTANFEIESYNITSNSFGVWVKNITGDADDIETVKVAVWKQEDQSDIQWIYLELNEEGDYFSKINMDMYNSESGTYQVHAYAETAHEEEVFLGEGTVEVYKAGSAR